MHDTESILSAVEFIGYLNALARYARNGIVPFSRVTPENRMDYDEALVYVDSEETASIPCDMAEDDVIADMLVDENHNDAISGWGNILSEVCGGTVTAKVVRPDDDGEMPYVEVYVEETETSIAIDGEGWHIT